MSRLNDVILKNKRNNEKILVGFITGGDPDKEKSVKIIKSMISGGIDILELGVPFSDPAADGPTIQASSQRALKSGTSLKDVFDIAEEIRISSEIPIIFFSYYNPILAFGPDRFYDKCRESGIDGLLVVDLPMEESKELTEQCPEGDIPLIPLIAPTTGFERMNLIAEKAKGFIYLISMTGVTGSEGLQNRGVMEVYNRLKPLTDIPVFVGFGISKPEQVRHVCEFADGVVVGSAFERIIEENLDKPDLFAKIEMFTESLKNATKIQSI